MSTTAADLKDLHELHRRLQAVQGKLEAGPKRIAAREQIVSKKETELEAARQKQKQLKMTSDQKTLQLKTNEAKIDTLKRKLNEASSNREYEIITSQIEADKVANSVLEDEILECLDGIDAQAKAIEKLQTELEASKADFGQFKTTFEATIPDLQEENDKLRSSLKEAETCIPVSERAQYQRLVAAHSDTALAAVESNACSECYTMLEPNIMVELNMGKIRFCRACGRLLYRE
ncbi:Putative zinc ribbon domain protein [Polystyrenella longa]|uniref:Zinc ribbon domain protein n=1 Tax=Polystyrenella longa TaxID=2528007 RepID=A0A518CPI6_9PLAN|nr:hypothetical protein [Polystyrenella longa]QDU81128.1 Putative zinc ribbon domain protein [Polystyrenella longa]